MSRWFKYLLLAVALMSGAVEARAKDVSSWTRYSIGRDNLGSITDTISADGLAVARYSYDPLYGRVLAPDPFVQAPDISQNFNLMCQ